MNSKADRDDLYVSLIQYIVASNQSINQDMEDITDILCEIARDMGVEMAVSIDIKEVEPSTISDEAIAI